MNDQDSTAEITESAEFFYEFVFLCDLRGLSGYIEIIII